MGQCGEVADDGEKSGGPPRPRNRYVCRKAAVSAPGSALREIRVEPLNLLQSVQTYFCLGHCITRGIGLRRQASILRLSGVVLSYPHISRRPDTTKIIVLQGILAHIGVCLDIPHGGVWAVSGGILVSRRCLEWAPKTGCSYENEADDC